MLESSLHMMGRGESRLSGRDLESVVVVGRKRSSSSSRDESQVSQLVRVCDLALATQPVLGSFSGCHPPRLEFSTPSEVAQAVKCQAQRQRPVDSASSEGLWRAHRAWDVGSRKGLNPCCVGTCTAKYLTLVSAALRYLT